VVRISRNYTFRGKTTIWLRSRLHEKQDQPFEKFGKSSKEECREFEAAPQNSWTFLYNDQDAVPGTDALALDTETLTYTLPGQPAFTRTLDRRRDEYLRPSGYTLADDANPEASVTYGYDPAGRLQTLAASGIPNLPDENHAFEYGYQSGSYGLVHTVAGPVHTVTKTLAALTASVRVHVGQQKTTGREHAVGLREAPEVLVG